MHWTWDPNKNRGNRQKHRIIFETAQLVFRDPYHLSAEDLYRYEQRWRTIGVVNQTAIIVVHTLPALSAESGRIISARKANSHERRVYEEGQHQIE